ncbi:hypothetical protein [Corynebacterium uterequi]|nr:hypothetical protein [Corynebacterium uterequi]
MSTTEQPHLTAREDVTLADGALTAVEQLITNQAIHAHSDLGSF